ncbi:MAG: DNA primase [Candidatus Peribacteraceae bacterium]|nr:DNA primase [Candidatus Peribacteraceae bacterium]
MDIRDEIKIRLPIDQLVAQYCQLQKKGRNFVCVCPFHNDTKPSFVVSPDKGIGYCFACNTGGDIFSFFQKIENVDFPTALKQLAEKVGVQLPAKTAYVPAEAPDVKERLRACLDAACAFFQQSLKASATSMKYLTDRGVTESDIATFRIGYAPDSFSATYDHLLKAGFSRSEIVTAGLGVQKELSEERIYDRFRERIMFPIMNVYGQIIGFGGRTLKANDDAKYLNSPESPLYHKSSVLFGLFQAKEEMRKHRKVVLVEGYFDVVAAHRAGIVNAVAVCGTALTDDHVKLLKRYSDTVVLCLDQDRAGKAAAEKAFQLLSRQQVAVQAVAIPAKDPDEMILKDAAGFQKAVSECNDPYLDGLLAQLALDKTVFEPSGRHIIADTLFPLFNSLGSSIELRAYMEKASRLFRIIESELSADFYRWRNASHTAPKNAPAPLEQSPFSRYELCIGIALNYPMHGALLTELIPDERPEWEAVRNFVSAYIEPKGNAQKIIATIDASTEMKHQMQVLALYCEENFGHWSEDLAKKELKKMCTGANKDAILKKQSDIIIRMKSARSSGKLEDEAGLLSEYQSVLQLAKKMSSADVMVE